MKLYLQIIIILSTLIIIPCAAKSEAIETWECVELNGATATVIAQINEGGKTGQIQIADIIYDTFVYSGTFFNRWDFGLNESKNAYNNALVIKSDGKGLFFDFTQGYTVEPTQRFKCIMKKK